MNNELIRGLREQTCTHSEFRGRIAARSHVNFDSLSLSLLATVRPRRVFEHLRIFEIATTVHMQPAAKITRSQSLACILISVGRLDRISSFSRYARFPILRLRAKNSEFYRERVSFNIRRSRRGIKRRMFYEHSYRRMLADLSGASPASRIERRDARLDITTLIPRTPLYLFLSRSLDDDLIRG